MGQLRSDLMFSLPISLHVPQCPLYFVEVVGSVVGTVGSLVDSVVGTAVNL